MQRQDQDAVENTKKARNLAAQRGRGIAQAVGEHQGGLLNSATHDSIKAPASTSAAVVVTSTTGPTRVMSGVVLRLVCPLVGHGELAASGGRWRQQLTPPRNQQRVNACMAASRVASKPLRRRARPGCGQSISTFHEGRHPSHGDEGGASVARLQVLASR